MWDANAHAQATYIFFSQNISVIFDDQSFNDTLTIDIVSFEQLGPDCLPGFWSVTTEAIKFSLSRSPL